MPMFIWIILHNVYGIVQHNAVLIRISSARKTSLRLPSTRRIATVYREHQEPVLVSIFARRPTPLFSHYCKFRIWLLLPT